MTTLKVVEYVPAYNYIEEIFNILDATKGLIIALDLERT